MRLPSRLSTPWHILLKEISAFGVAGAINFAVDLGIFNVLHFTLGVDVLAAKTVSTTVSTTLSYFMNRHWSFSHRARSGLRREYTLFIGLNAVALLFALGVLYFTNDVLNYHDRLSINVANVIGIGIGTIFRFWSYKRWVFMHEDKLRSRPPARV